MQWQPSHISVVILAGGQSSRMGKNKALLMREGKTQLQHCVDLMTEMGFAEVKVSGQYHGYQCVLDLHPQLGPLAGIEAGVLNAGSYCTGLLVLPVDMPLLSKEEVRELLAQANAQGGYYDEALFPMLLALNDSLTQYLAALLQQDNPKLRSLYQLLKHVNCKKVVANAQQFSRLANANTPEQWQSLTQMGGG